MSNQSIEAITLSPESKGPLSVKAITPEQTPAVSFSNLISQGIGNVNDKLISSQGDLQQVAMGETGNLHQVMIRLEEAKMSFQLMMQVRNKLLEAYQEILKMQV